MPFSSGTFSRVHDWTSDRDAGIKISASRTDAEFDGIATGLTSCILKDGTQTLTAMIPFTLGLSVPTDKKIQLRDSAIFINSSGDGELNMAADTSVTITTPSLIITDNTTDEPIVQIKNTHNGTTAGELRFVMDKGAAGADGDDLGTISFFGDDSGQNQTAFAKIVGEVSETDDTDEAGKLSFFVAESDGTNTALTAGLVLEGEHATDGEVDVTIGAGAASQTTVAGHLNIASGGITIDTVGQALGVGTNNPSHAIQVHHTAPEILLEETSTGGSKRISMGVTSAGQPFIAAEQSGGSIEFDLSTVVNTKIHQYRVNIGTSPSKDSTAADIADGSTTQGAIISGQDSVFAVNGQFVLECNRTGTDGSIVLFKHNGTTEGSVSISGNTTSYNAFTGSHWSRLTDNSKPTILRGTVVESIDDMMDWYHLEFTKPELKYQDGDDIPKGKKVGDVSREEFDLKKDYDKPSDVNVGDTVKYKDEDGIEYDAKVVLTDDVKHVKCKISDTADCTNVYGVFMDWDNDDDCHNDMYVNAVGTSLVRIHKDQTVAKGDLITSNGDGSAKKQDDDIIRSKTIGKVLTNIKQETYSDGSYTVPCALYCG